MIKKWYYKSSQLTDFNIQNLNIDYDKKKIPVINLDLEVEISNLSTTSGKRFFIQPNLLNKWMRIPDKDDERKRNLIFANEYQESDSLIFTLPENLHVEYMPEPVSIETVFGSFTYSIVIEGNQLIYHRTLSMNKGTFDKSLYNDYRNFRKEIAKGDKAKVVLIDKT